MELRHHDNEKQALSLAAAQVQYKRGSYASSLDLAIKACGASSAPMAPGSQSALLMESLSLATRAALCCSNPAKALKYASRMVFLDPQDVMARDLARECTREMEYEARLLALKAAHQPSSAATHHKLSGSHMPGKGTGSAAQAGQLHIYTLLARLEEGGQPADVASVLNQLTQATSQGVDSQIAFLLASGYATSMNYMVSHPQEVEGLLMAAGICRLYQPSHGKHQRHQQHQQQHQHQHQQQQQQPQSQPSQVVRVRWPQSVLDRLVTLALDTEQDPDLACRCMGLLAVAAQDRLQRHRAFVTRAPPSSARGTQPACIVQPAPRSLPYNSRATSLRRSNSQVEPSQPACCFQPPTSLYTVSPAAAADQAAESRATEPADLENNHTLGVSPVQQAWNRLPGVQGKPANKDRPAARSWYPALPACRPVLTNSIHLDPPRRDLGLGLPSWPFDASHHIAPAPAECAHIRAPLVDRAQDHLSGPPTPPPTPPPLPGLWTFDTPARTMHDQPIITHTGLHNQTLSPSTHSASDPSISQPCETHGPFMSMSAQAGVMAACGHGAVDTDASSPSGGASLGVCTPPAVDQQSMSSNRQSLDGTGAITPTTCTLLKAEQLSLELWSLYEAAGSTATPLLTEQQEQPEPTASTQPTSPDYHTQSSPMGPGCNPAQGTTTTDTTAATVHGALAPSSMQRSRSEGWKGLLGLAWRAPDRHRDHQDAKSLCVGSIEHTVAEAPEASACSLNQCCLPAPDSVLSSLVAGLHALCQEAKRIEAFQEPACNRRATDSTGVGAGLGTPNVMPVEAAVCAAQLLHSFCTDDHSLHLLSATQQPIATLLALHQTLHTPGAPGQRTPVVAQQCSSPAADSLFSHGVKGSSSVLPLSNTSAVWVAAGMCSEQTTTTGMPSHELQQRASNSFLGCAWAASELCSTARTAPACCAAARVTLDCVSCLCGRVQGAAMAEALYPPCDASTSTSEPHSGSSTATPTYTLSDYHLQRQRPHSGSTADVPSRRLARSVSTTSLASHNGSARLLPTPLLASLVLYARNVVASSPSCMQPETGLRDCLVKGYTLGKRAADPCEFIMIGSTQPAPTPLGCEASSSTSFTTAQPSLPPNPPSTSLASSSTSILQAWLRIFTTLAGVGRQVSRELFRAGLTDVLKDITTQFRTDSELVNSVQKAWSRLALHCPGALEESLEEGHTHGIIGVAAHGLKCMCSRIDQPLASPAGPFSHRRSSSAGSGSSVLSSDSSSRQQRSLRHTLNITLRSLDKLAQLLDSCSGAEFLELVREQGLLSLVHMLVGRNQPRHVSRSFSHSATMRNREYTNASPPASNSPATPCTPSGSPASPASPWLQPLPAPTNLLPRRPSMPMGPQPTSTCSTHPTALHSAAAPSPAPFLNHPTPPSAPTFSASSKPVLRRSTTDLIRVPLGRASVELPAAPGDVCGELLPAMCDAARCVLLGCLERARRAAGLRPDQVPCVGWFGTICPKQLLNLEQGLRAQWAAALLPHQPPRLPAIPGTPPRTSWPGRAVGGFAQPAADESLQLPSGSTTASVSRPPGCKLQQAAMVTCGSGAAGPVPPCPGTAHDSFSLNCNLTSFGSLASTGYCAGATDGQQLAGPAAKLAAALGSGDTDGAGAGPGHHPSLSAGPGPAQSQAEAWPATQEGGASSLECNPSAGWHGAAMSACP